MQGGIRSAGAGTCSTALQLRGGWDGDGRQLGESGAGGRLQPSSLQLPTSSSSFLLLWLGKRWGVGGASLFWGAGSNCWGKAEPWLCAPSPLCPPRPRLPFWGM